MKRLFWRPRGWRLAAILSVAALGCGGLAAVAGPALPAAAAGSCSAQYVVNSDWGTGFSIAITITNTGPAISSWTLTYAYSGSQKITAGWSGNWSQSGPNVTVTNASWNGSLATGASTQIGANGSETSPGPVPTVFFLNGTQCGGGGGGNTVTVTSPGNQTTVVGTAVSLQVKGSDSGSGQTLNWSASGLPTGLSISSSGLISGTPTTPGTSSVAVTAKDGTGATGSASFSWTITAKTGNTVTVTNPGNQFGTVGTAASLQVQATDSASGQTLTFTATGLPAGLSISSSGLISGTPTTAATSSVTVTAKDGTGVTGSASFTWTISTSTNNGGAPQLQVSGNKLVNSATGAQVVLHGVNRSGGEYSCVNGTGIFDGAMDQTAVSAIKAWNVNAVRVPLNEACWNAESYVNASFAGANYISAVKTYVNLLNSNGIVAILDLHWTDGLYTGPSAGCSSAQAVCQKPMPDTAQAIPFWTSVAQTFKGNDAVIFDLFNEPYASRATGSMVSGWQCWLNGGTCPGINYQVAGMQAMVNAVRSTGANNVIMVGGLEYSNDLGTPGNASDPSILTNLPSDPDHDIAVSWHSYNFNTCSNQSCWTSQVAPVIAQVPVIAGEIGENDCASGYVTPLMTWLDGQHSSYLAWAWNADFNCSSGPGLVSDYSGTPTNYGAGVKSHLLSLGG